MADPFTILTVNTCDVGGGAEKIAAELRRAYAELGHASYSAVGRKFGHDPAVFQIKHGPWYSALRSASDFLDGRCNHIRGIPRLSRALRFLAHPGASTRVQQGYDIPHYRDSAAVLRLPPRRPDVLHLHNLHGVSYEECSYFDLHALPALSRQLPVFLTLHDAWLLSGHCAHSIGCDRWKTGCGQCPDLTIYPGIPVDRTAENWREREQIYRESRLYVATPSAWLMDKVQQSMLAAGIVEARVIPNGVDLDVFKPADPRVAREGLRIQGITGRTRILLFTANTLRHNPFKDYGTLRAALEALASRSDCSDLVLLALGAEGSEERIGGARLCFVPFENDPRIVARFYQAADIYVHAAKADTFPTTVLEALACGKPVVATAVGGIPEQVYPLQGTPGTAFRDGAGAKPTGILTRPGDASGLADALEHLLNHEGVRQALAENAARDARERFDQRKQAGTYLEWYQSILAQRRRAKPYR